MAETQDGVELLTLERSLSAYLEATAKKLEQHERVAVTRFVSWYGPSRMIGEMTAHEMTLFQEAVGDNAADLEHRLRPVKAFLAHAKKKKWTGANLGVHLRLKRQAKFAGGGARVVRGDEEAVDMTPEGLITAKEEVERLRGERPEMAAVLQRAMEDGDVRENAPLDAARDSQALLEARIRELEYQIGHARVGGAGGAGRPGQAHLGSTVTLTNLVSDQTVRYTLVGQSEVDTAAGRISVVSPVGRALIGRAAGDELEVTAPVGMIQFRVEAVEG